MSEAEARLETWFAARGWSPFAFQREVWSAYANGESGLIHAATGTGKTYAAWMGPVLEALANERPPAGSKLRESATERAGGLVHWSMPRIQ